MHVDVNIRSSREATDKLNSDSLVSYKIEVGSTAVQIAKRNEDNCMVEFLREWC